ncbi:MAG TPA: Asp23/Gls24 family envelope stress response protein, partial [Frankiaceae bacterium]|nr:Asp23/Gls24 family envelope stress response protein [Frankiaceae bacterium]
MSTPASTSSSSAGSSAGSAGSPDRRPASREDGGSSLTTKQGNTSISDGVVRKIAGIATRATSGVYNLGGGSSRAFGALRERIPGSGGPNISQGVSVEVGERQTAIDLDIVVEYGVGIAEL